MRTFKFRKLSKLPDSICAKIVQWSWQHFACLNLSIFTSGRVSLSLSLSLCRTPLWAGCHRVKGSTNTLHFNRSSSSPSGPSPSPFAHFAPFAAFRCRVISVWKIDRLVIGIADQPPMGWVRRQFSALLVLVLILIPVQWCLRAHKIA